MSSEIPRLEPRRAPRSAVATLIGSLLIPVACGDNAVDSTTTAPPITIESTTTIPPTTIPSTTTTTIPEPSTTTTTVPETTTTTLPADIGQPSGEIWLDNSGALEPLGIVSISRRENVIETAVLSGRITDLYIEQVNDFQGESVDVAFLEISLGEYTNGEPFIVKFMIGRLEDDVYIRVSDIPITGHAYGNVDLVSNLIKDPGILLRLQRYSQIQIGLTTEDINNSSTNYCMLPENINHPICVKFLGQAGHLDINKRIIELLQKEEISPEDALKEGDYGSLVDTFNLYPIEI